MSWEPLGQLLALGQFEWSRTSLSGMGGLVVQGMLLNNLQTSVSPQEKYSKAGLALELEDEQGYLKIGALPFLCLSCSPCTTER